MQIGTPRWVRHEHPLSSQFQREIIQAQFRYVCVYQRAGVLKPVPVFRCIGVSVRACAETGFGVTVYRSAYALKPVSVYRCIGAPVR